MRIKWKGCLVYVLILSLAIFVSYGPALAAKPAKAAAKAADPLGKANARFDVNKMSDMSDYDPANPVVPTGDTIKIAVVAAFSGPSAFNGQSYFFIAQWVAHDINKRGGIMVDGKKKLIQVIKADHMSKADQCKKVCERMALQEKVHFFWGTDGSHFMKIINETANKYKVIAMNVPCLSDDLQDATNFSRYAFHTAYSTEQIARGLAYYYGQIRKKEKKFYILNQDYAFGHSLAEAFKKGLKEYYPEAQIVGEDYHKLFLTDFAPYLTKVKASGAEVIFTGDWLPDAGNLLKQARQMGLNASLCQRLHGQSQLPERSRRGRHEGARLISARTARPVPSSRTRTRSNFTRPGTTCGRTSGKRLPTTASLTNMPPPTGPPGSCRPTGCSASSSGRRAPIRKK